ncbi:efflux RND transporter periplasmic adaptor subunit [Methylotenera versatilis]|uniref:efflux RND transporter periplasmic adaptor subunit n=1 Tax=Methylotenera versatilis TaxID=1055487 RepID=UPI0012699FC2|nr:efflux RND transporter periplasmic adaptor subunit [Methylotenera versatilis]
MKNLLLLTLMIVVSACSSKAPPAKPAEIEVGYVTLTEKPVPSTVRLSGRVTSTITSEIRPQVTGILSKRLFVEGSHVKAGDVLYQIEPAIYQAALDQANATLLNAEAAVSAAKLKSERYNELLEIQGISKQDADDAKVSYQQALATVAQNKAVVSSAKINLGFTEIRAPISGIIGKSSVTPGALLTANQTDALAVIRVLDPVFVDLIQSSDELFQLKKALSTNGVAAGSKSVNLILPDGSTYDKPGVLKFAEVSVDESTNMVTLRAEFPNAAKVLLPGMFVRAEIDQLINKNTVLAPQQGVTRNPNGEATALVLTAENKVEQRLIKAEKILRNQWIVSSGLSAGDRIIVEGLNKIKVGDKVKPIEIVSSNAAQESSGEINPTSPSEATSKKAN